MQAQAGTWGLNIKPEEHCTSWEKAWSRCLFASTLTLLSHSPMPQLSCSGDHDSPSLRSTSVVTHHPMCPLYCSPHISVDSTTIVSYNIYHHSYLLSSQSVFHLILKQSTKQHDCRLLPGYTLSTILRDRVLVLT